MTRRVDVHVNGEPAAVALVSDDDHGHIAQHTWRMHSRGYAVASFYGTTHLMHRVVANAPDGYEVDHVNGDKLDNRRENLRVVTKSANQRNRVNGTSRHRRVSRDLPRNVYRHGDAFQACVTVDGTQHYLGRFDTVDEAAAAVTAFRAEVTA